MDEVCGNCEHFNAKNLGSGEHFWGICVRSEDGDVEPNAEKSGGVCRWGEAVCGYFKAREEANRA